MRRPIIDEALALAEKVPRVKSRLVCHVGFEDGIGVDDAVDLDAVDAVGPAGGRVDQMLLLAATTTDLRRAVTRHDVLPTAASMIVAVGDVPDAPGVPVIIPSVMRRGVRLENVESLRVADGWMFNLSFSGHAPSGEMVIRIARGLTGVRIDPGLPVCTDATGPQAAHWRPGDAPSPIQTKIEHEAGAGIDRVEVPCRGAADLGGTGPPGRRSARARRPGGGASRR